MAEMFVTTPEIKKTVEDYDIVLKSGIMIPLTVDPACGDTIEIGERTILINLTPKPSLSDPTRTLPAEDITIYVNHVASIQHRRREIIEQTPTQREEWAKVLQELTTTSVQ